MWLQVVFKGSDSHWYLIWSIHLCYCEALWIKVTPKKWNMLCIFYDTVEIIKGYTYSFSHTLSDIHTDTHQFMAVSSHTVRARLRAKRGHFDYSSKMTCFTQSSPHFGCKLNVGFGLESWAGSLAEYQYAAAIPPHQLCNPIGLFNEINSTEVLLSIYIHFNQIHGEN